MEQELLEYLEKCETNKFFFVETDEDECVSLESFYIIDSEYDANKICEQLNKILLGMKNALSKKTE